jgi:hypothetical protein
LESWPFKRGGAVKILMPKDSPQGTSEVSEINKTLSLNPVSRGLDVPPRGGMDDVTSLEPGLISGAFFTEGLKEDDMAFVYEKISWEYTGEVCS